jgi:NAD(P)-dependent dehydrogenase (short-subunit alcohol dehydrogenase family)
MIPMGIPHIEVADVTNAVLYLCSEESRYVTGTVLEVTAGKSAMWSS